MVNFKSHRWIFSDPLRFRCMEFSTILITVTHVFFSWFARLIFEGNDPVWWTWYSKGWAQLVLLIKDTLFLFNSKVNVISKYIYIVFSPLFREDSDLTNIFQRGWFKPPIRYIYIYTINVIFSQLLVDCCFGARWLRNSWNSWVCEPEDLRGTSTWPPPSVQWNNPWLLRVGGLYYKPRRLTAGTWSHDGFGSDDNFRTSRGVFTLRFQPLIFRGCIYYTKPLYLDVHGS